MGIWGFGHVQKYRFSYEREGNQAVELSPCIILEGIKVARSGLSRKEKKKGGGAGGREVGEWMGRGVGARREARVQNGVLKFYYAWGSKLLLPGLCQSSQTCTHIHVTMCTWSIPVVYLISQRILLVPR